MAAENFASRQDNSKILTARNFVSRRKSRQDSHRGLAAKLPAEISISRRDITSRSRRVLAAEISVSRRDLAATSRRVFACRDFHILLRSRRESRQDRGAFLAAEISRFSARIAASFWPTRFPVSHRDLAAISAVISARWGNLGGQKRAAISPRSRRDLVKIFTREVLLICSQNVTVLQVFFWLNLIFALTARMLSGNRLNYVTFSLLFYQYVFLMYYLVKKQNKKNCKKFFLSKL